MSAVVAAVCAGTALALLLGSGGGRARVRGSRRTAWYLCLGGGAVAATWLIGQPRLLVIAGIGLGVLGFVTRGWRNRREDRLAQQERARVVETCDLLRAELSAGRSPVDALTRAGGDWPVMAAVARAAGHGGDVPAALRDAAGGPGAGELRILAAAWQVAHRTGHGLADAVARVAADLRSAERTRRVVAGELASARATARLIALLPLFALLMGSGAGGDPWAFLFGHPLGLACLAAGLGFGCAGWAWLEAIARSVEREQ